MRKHVLGQSKVSLDCLGHYFKMKTQAIKNVRLTFNPNNVTGDKHRKWPIYWFPERYPELCQLSVDRSAGIKDSQYFDYLEYRHPTEVSIIKSLFERLNSECMDRLYTGCINGSAQTKANKIVKNIDYWFKRVFDKIGCQTSSTGCIKNCCGELYFTRAIPRNTIPLWVTDAKYSKFRCKSTLEHDKIVFCVGIHEYRIRSPRGKVRGFIVKILPFMRNILASNLRTGYEVRMNIQLVWGSFTYTIADVLSKEI